mgnify:CR=1 FL=1
MNLDLISQVTELVRTESRSKFGISDVVVLTKANDPFVPDEMAFIIARGAVDVAPKYPYSQPLTMRLYSQLPTILIRIPTLVWRVDGNTAVCGDGRTIQGEWK